MLTRVERAPVPGCVNSSLLEDEDCARHIFQARFRANCDDRGGMRNGFRVKVNGSLFFVFAFLSKKKKQKNLVCL